jgi:hypothetical protein
MPQTVIPSTTQKSFQPNNKDVRYLNKDFASFRQNLINFAKYYYPNTYADFNDAAPGMMFIDMASYVGDVLSYYIDYAFKESLIYDATERKNIIALAKNLGYTPQPVRGATGQIQVSQICPATTDVNGNYVPDPSYLLSIQDNMQVSNNAGASFLTNQTIDFSFSSSLSPLSQSVYQRDNTNVPTFFLLQKSTNIRSGQVVQQTFTINAATPFLNIYLPQNNILEIISVVDSDNNTWYEVDYLAQDMVLADQPNTDASEGELSQFQTTVPYILDYLSTSRRFTVNVDANNLTYLQFGPGTSGFADEIINLSSQQVGVGLSNVENLNISLDPSNFLNNDTYGLAPSNTTLTVTYTTGGGFQSNSPSNSIININSVSVNNTTEGLTPEQVNLLNTVITSLTVNNQDATVGGAGPETNSDIQQNAIANFGGQNRIVTQNDYLARVYSLPAKYGTIAKAQVITYNSLNVNQSQILTGTVNNNNVATVSGSNVQNFFRNIYYDQSNPFAVNLYILSYDANQNLTQANSALVTNLMTYLRQFRMLTDSINVIDGYIVNIGVEFVITTLKGYNKKDVVANCITAVQNFFDINKWEFSQAINLSSLRLEIAKIDGVQTVVSLNITNLTPATTNGGNYSSVAYDIAAATQNDTIYPSLDPSMWEVKYPNTDIVGTSL